MDFEKLVETLTEEIYREIVEREIISDKNLSKNSKKIEISKYIDHTLLKANATKDEIEKLCYEAIEHNFFSVCVNPHWIKFCREKLKNSSVKVCSVIGFPLGATPQDVKEYECRRVILDGADEIDMVMNIGEFKSKNYEKVRKEIEDIKKICEKYGVTLKVIIETCYLTTDEIKKATQISVDAKADFVKTSTGFGTGGAKIEDIKVMKEVARERAKIKAAGGIRDYETALKMIDAGASRIGTSSGIKIIQEEKSLFNE